MKSLATTLAVLSLGACGPATGVSESVGEVLQASTGDNGMNGAPEHLQLQKGARKGGGSSSPLMTFHGGGHLGGE